MNAISPFPENDDLELEAPAVLTEKSLLEALKSWSTEGWLRRLDSAFARFMVDLAPGEAPAVLLAAALCAHMEGRGHACLQIDLLIQDANGLLGWPPKGAAAMATVMAGMPGASVGWLSALKASTLVYVDVGADAVIDGNQPLVLSGSRLYLRRYWAYEKRIAGQVLARGALPVPL